MPPSLLGGGKRARRGRVLELQCTAQAVGRFLKPRSLLRGPLLRRPTRQPQPSRLVENGPVSKGRYH